jgi:hypothetical protein
MVRFELLAVSAMAAVGVACCTAESPPSSLDLSRSTGGTLSPFSTQVSPAQSPEEDAGSAPSAPPFSQPPLPHLPDGGLSTVVSSEAGASSSLRSADVVAKLRGWALQHSAWAGVPSPATMRAVYASDRQAAEFILSGSIVNDHVPVYVVEMTGGPPFTARRHPRGVAPTQGNALTVTIDAERFAVTDLGYHHVVPDLRQISTDVVDLTDVTQDAGSD